jgi:HNH/ENDO VII superfamily nuclease with conserved GHE residues
MSDLNTGATQGASGGDILDKAGSWLSSQWDKALHAAADNNDVSQALHGAGALADHVGMTGTGKWLNAAGDGVSTGEYKALNAVTDAVKSTGSMAYNLSPQGYFNAAAKAAGFQVDPHGPDAGKVLKPLANTVVNAAKTAAPYALRYAEGDPTVGPELAQKAGDAAYDRYVKPFAQNDPETGFNHVFGDAGTVAGVAATFAATDGLGELSNVGRVGELSTLGDDAATLASRAGGTLDKAETALQPAASAPADLHPVNTGSPTTVQPLNPGTRFYVRPDGEVLDANTYARNSGFRTGVRDQVWADAADPRTGVVEDPLSGQQMDPSKAWDMGHRPGMEYWKERDNAINEWLHGGNAISRKDFLDIMNDPARYRPELPESNRSHAGEDSSNSFWK